MFAIFVRNSGRFPDCVYIIANMMFYVKLWGIV
jgi:hypothetical protein